jgi:curved DNA-binding protein
VRFEFGGEGDFGDLFGDLFGGGRGGGGSIFEGFTGARAPEAGALLELGLEDALTGGRRRLAVGDREFEVDIPAGIRDGQRLRVCGEDDESDLVLRIRLRPTPPPGPGR